MLLDQLGRPLRDLRISVTDRCNLRCTYCMPAEVFGANYAFVPREELLSFEEIERLTHIFVELGVKKLRITGGEPTLRQNLVDLIARLSSIGGIQDIAMTTNGLLLSRLASSLKKAGLQRITISLDSLDPSVFGKMNGLGIRPKQVLDGIEAALQAGLLVKVNTVVQRHVNDQQLSAFWHTLRDMATVRFIEFMDVGNHNGWNMQSVVPSREILAKLGGDFEPQEAHYRGEVASRYVSSDGYEVGLISSVTAPFCRDCSRARLSAVGMLYTCLFAGTGTDLKKSLRCEADKDQLRQVIIKAWNARKDQYSEERGKSTRHEKVEMSHIGG